jgi:predicted kinase
MKKQKIILTRGLPASGKSTWSSEQVAKSNGKIKRVNKDLLREMIDAGIYSKTNEQQILAARDALVNTFLGMHVEAVIVDDTNFEEKHFNAMKDIADQFKTFTDRDITVEYKDFLDVSLDVCLERDALRVKPVGEKVIKDMHQRYILPTIQRNIGANILGDSIIVDVDGTICYNNGHRGWFDYSKVIDDEPINPIINMVKMYKQNNYNVLIVSAREGTDECREATVKWLNKHNVPFDYFFMRKERDYRRDSIVKEEIYNEHIKGKFNVEIVLDDRSAVVGTWRNLGLRCAQVAPGDF